MGLGERGLFAAMQQMSSVRAWPGTDGPLPVQGAGLVLIPGPGVPPAQELRALLAGLALPLARVAGVDARLDDPRLPVPVGAGAFVMVLPPPGTLDNAFYRVHRRRNDRFLLASPRLKALFPEVDFAQFDFTGHMLGTLARLCPERFAMVRRALAVDWTARMGRLIAVLPPRGVLAAMAQPAHLPYPGLVLGPGLRRIALEQATPDDLAHALAEVLGQVQ